MSKPILIFYHCALNLGDRQWARQLISEQMNTMVTSGLAAAATDIVIGLNGDETDAVELSLLVPKGSQILLNQPDMWPSGEVPTMRVMHEWIRGYEPSHVLYFHTKGLTFPPNNGAHQHRVDWRKSMEAVVLHRWRECIAHMEAGYESVGQWWNVAFNGQYWAGNFFWATSDFLLTLPYLSIEDQNQGGRYEAEVWIGRGPRLPHFAAL